jgi:hypothetical protein
VHPGSDSVFLPLRIPFGQSLLQTYFGVILPVFSLLVNKIPKKCPKTPVPMAARPQFPPIVRPMMS